MSFYAGAKIRQFREWAGMSQEVLASRIGVPTAQLAQWESGKTFPDLDSIKKISEELNVDKNEITKDDITKLMVLASRGKNSYTKTTVITILFLFVGLACIFIVGLSGLFVGSVVIGYGVFYAKRKGLFDKEQDADNYKSVIADYFNQTVEQYERGQTRAERDSSDTITIIVLIFFAAVLILAMLIKHFR